MLHVNSLVACFSMLAAATALKLPGGPPIAGCGMLGCEPGLSFVTALQLPQSATTTILWSTPLLSSSSTTSSSSSPSTLFSNPGCVSQSTYVLCTFPLLMNTSSGFAQGMVGIDGTSGNITYTWNSTGGGRCSGSGDQSAWGKPETLPIMDAYGDAVLFDNYGITLLQGGEMAWTQYLYPSSPCGDVLLSPSVSNTSRLLFAVSTDAELFGYYEDSVPVASVVLFANETGGNSGSSKSSTSQHRGDIGSSNAASPPPPPVDLPPAEGLAIPISLQASNGIRFLYICRFYRATVPLSSSSSLMNGNRQNQPQALGMASSSSSRITDRPLLTPTSTLILASMDLHDNSIPRMATPWQFHIPLAPLFPAYVSCVPPSAGNFPGPESLYVAGPLILPDNTALVVLSCNASATSSDNNNTYPYIAVISFAMDEPQGPVPSIVFATNISTSSGSSGSSSSSSSSGSIIIRSTFLDAWYAETGLVWLSPEGSDTLLSISGVDGSLQGTVNITSLIVVAAESSSNVSSDCSDLASVMRSQSSLFMLSGRPIAGTCDDSRSRSSTSSNISSIVILTGEINTGTSSSSSSSSSSSNYWMLGVGLSSASSRGGGEGGTLLWCQPSPNGRKIEGQITAVQKTTTTTTTTAAVVGAQSAVVFTTQDGIFAVG